MNGKSDTVPIEAPMSNAALNWAWGKAPSLTSQIVLARLADRASDPALTCYPSIKSIAADTRIDERTVRRALRELEAAGLVRCEMREHLSTVYHVLMTPGGTVPAPGGHTAPTTGADCPPPEGTPPAPWGHTARQTLIEPKEEPKEKERRTRRVRDCSREPDGFAEFYAAYPRKTARDDAARAYAAALKRGAVPADLIAALIRCQWPDDPKFIPHPATWLNKGRWKDEKPSAQAQPADRQTKNYRNGFLALAVEEAFGLEGSAV